MSTRLKQGKIVVALKWKNNKLVRKDSAWLKYCESHCIADTRYC